MNTGSAMTGPPWTIANRGVYLARANLAQSGSAVEGLACREGGRVADADVLVIGAGASGAALSWRLSGAGVRVICLEQGGWVRPEDIPSDRPDWEVARMTRWSP